ncbi:MAG: transglycosylase SLT domain-containing protein [Microcystis aeruginosa]
MQTYTIKSGDTLRGIALKFYGDASKFVVIQEANDIANPNQISMGQVLEIPDLADDNDNNPLENFHRAFPNSVRWRLAEDGVEIEGSGIERTSGQPATTTKIWNNFSDEINQWSKHFNVPAVIIIATIATESNGKADAIRKEPGYVSDSITPHLISVGLMQTLISTARGTLHNSTIDRDDLKNASISIKAGTSFIADQRLKTLLDPPKVACAYNAGSLFENKNPNNRWRMRQFPIGTSAHCDRFIKFFNDAVFVLQGTTTTVSVGYQQFYLA